MLVKKHIKSTLNGLDVRFNNALRTPTPQDSVYYSKLAVLEYCGWIEETFDLIVYRSLKEKLKTEKYKKILKEAVVERTHGFQYKTHFRPMLSNAIGLCNMEKIEQNLKDNGQFEVLTSELASMKEHRNSAAHTWVDGPTRTYPAPSTINASFEILYPIINCLYSQVVHI